MKVCGIVALCLLGAFGRARGQNETVITNLRSGEHHLEEAGHRITRAYGEDSSDFIIGKASVIGEDTRVRVHKTQRKPFKQIGRIIGGGSVCTGTVIGRDKILTAAHCIWSKKKKRFMKLKYFVPGKNGSHEPYGRWKVQRYIFHSGFSKKKRYPTQYDYGVLILKPNKHGHIGDYLGKLNMIPTPSSIDPNSFIAGYPGDKRTKKGNGRTMWSTGKCSSWRNRKGKNKAMISYTCDTYGGMSGSAILDSKNRIIGVHAYGFSKNGKIKRNSGVKLTKKIIRNIKSWGYKKTKKFHDDFDDYKYEY